jgi:selenocysteine lyase/cysteine desulfurase
MSMARKTDASATEPALDLSFARAAFPALAGETVFMDNAGGSLTLGSVADRIRDYLLTTDVQLGASYGVSVAASERYASARDRFADYVNAEASEEIVFGASTTMLLRSVAEAMRPLIEPGDEIVVTNVDHEANIGCWLGLEAVGARIRFWERNHDTGALELDDLDALLGERTRLVCVGHVSNVLGAIHPIRAVARRARAVGAWSCVDGVAYAPHRAVDVRALEVDFYAFSLYKVYGPHHALLYARREPFLQLANLNHFFYDRNSIPHKLEPGNANYELSWGAAGVVDYLEALGARSGWASQGGAGASSEPSRGGGLGADTEVSDALPGAAARMAAWAAIAAHEEALAERLLAFLRGREDVRIIGPSTADRTLRVPTISFAHHARSSSEIVSAVDRHGIGIRYGHFYAHRLVEDLGLMDQDGVVRVSLVHYNTLDEVERLVGVLEEVLG